MKAGGFNPKHAKRGGRPALCHQEVISFILENFYRLYPGYSEGIQEIRRRSNEEYFFYGPEYKDRRKTRKKWFVQIYEYGKYFK